MVDDGRTRGGQRVVSLEVDGMGCRRCVREVSRRLRDVAGVDTVEADAAARWVRVTGTMTAADLLEVLAGTSYRARTLDRGDGGDGGDRGDGRTPR